MDHVIQEAHEITIHPSNFNREDGFILKSVLVPSDKCAEISSSHGGGYDVQSCLLGYTAV
jgi:hypothetical protein